MCDVLPTISEDSISQRSSQFSGGEDANFEQLMVSMLDERDKLMDSLREAQERLTEMESKLGDCEKERDSLQRQINANLPQVSVVRLHSQLVSPFNTKVMCNIRLFFSLIYLSIFVGNERDLVFFLHMLLKSFTKYISFSNFFFLLFSSQLIRRRRLQPTN